MIPLTKKLGLKSTRDYYRPWPPPNYHSGEDKKEFTECGWIYYIDSGRLVQDEKDWKLGFYVAAKRGLIKKCTKRPWFRDNRLTEYGKSMMKLMG